MKRLAIRGRTVRLEAVDFGGEGSPALLLHGLAGTALEWEETADWLTQSRRVIALDQRGHGRSERRPANVSREAFVDDAVATIEELGLAPAVLVGQSLGGHAAFLVAARKPDLVNALVVAEASPEATDAEEVVRIGSQLSGWPIPFGNHEQAQEFFGGDTLAARAWARNLEGADGGLRPAFEVDIMVAALEASCEDRWAEWRSIRAPTLVVRGERGDLSGATAEEMARALPLGGLATIPGAGHDVHLEAPEAWRGAVETFLGGLS